MRLTREKLSRGQRAWLWKPRASDVAAWLVSFGLHLGLVVVLAACVHTAGAPSRGMLLCGAISASHDFAVEVLPELTTEPTGQDTFPAEAPSISLDYEFDFDVELTANTARLETNPLPIISASGRSSLVSSAEQTNVSRRAGVAFMGAYAKGQRFVYVLDSSTSMSGQRWVYACNQLIESLNRLTPDQEFFIISFDLRPGFLFARQPSDISFYRNSPATITKVKRWLKNKVLSRGTRPARAMLHALRMKPDAIFFLSDGELQDDTAFQLLQHNQPTPEHAQIPIHTIHLFSLDGRGTLQSIALANGGTFTPVNGM